MARGGLDTAVCPSLVCLSLQICWHEGCTCRSVERLPETIVRLLAEEFCQPSALLMQVYVMKELKQLEKSKKENDVEGALSPYCELLPARAAQQRI